MLCALLWCTSVSGENYVLELDGKGSYVEFSPEVFKDLTEATVEGWVKWDSLGRWSRFFDFGHYGHGMSVALRENTPNLGLNMGVTQSVHTATSDWVRTNEWCHIAAVTGPGGTGIGSS